MRFALLFFFTFCSIVVSAQIDTIFSGSKVYVRDGITRIYDTATWRSIFQKPALEQPVTKRTGSVHRILNDCGVTASFIPGDSVLISGAQIQFTSTSTNASSYQWFIDNFPLGIQANPKIYITAIGTHEIKLVAKNGNCSDTATANYLVTGNVSQIGRSALMANYGLPGTEETATSFSILKDGCFLLGGYSNVYKEGDRGILIKIRPTGCIEWTKLFQGELLGRVVNTTPTSDSGFLVSIKGNQSCLLRMTKDGDVKWKYSYIQQNSAVVFNVLSELTDGSIIAAGMNANFYGFYLTRLLPDGTVSWTKYYQKALDSMARAKSVVELNGTLYVSGDTENPNHEAPFDSEFNQDGFIMSTDITTGATNWCKAYGAIKFSDFFNDIHVYGNNLLVNSVRTKFLGGAKPHQAFHFITTDGTVLKSSKVVNATGFDGELYTQVVPLSGDRLYLSQSGYQTISLQPGYMWQSNWEEIDTSNTIRWQKLLSDYWRPSFPCTTTDDKESLIALGTGLSLLQSDIYSSSNFYFIKIDSANIKNNYPCTFYPVANSVVPDTILSSPFTWRVDKIVGFQMVPRIQIPNVAYSQVRYTCPDFLDSCSFIKLSGPATLCNISKTYTYRLTRNRGCFQPVQWELPDNIQVVVQNDSLVQIKFPRFGNYKIAALLNFNCTPVKDSIYVLVQSSSPRMELGSDTTICSNTVIALNAGAGFASYQWQDQSTGPNFNVSSPGIYWVQASDNCGNILSDTIRIKSGNATINLGPDRTKCINDTLHINAPPGFLNYTWSANYYLSSGNAQNVVVNPPADTAYYVKAEKTPGCFAYDTVRVHVNTSLPLNLGGDKSFCNGDSVVFDAGSGFNQYTWNNGSSSQRITVKAAGIFSVIGITAQGCKSYDTVKVLNVLANPVVSLDHTNFICAGSSKVLDAGSFASYIWNNGSSAQKITINNTGTYAVEVTDNNGCKGSDTVRVTNMLPLPSGFLPADTLLCSYHRLTVAAIRSYSAYLWNTGVASASITVSQPGNYWLQVKDANGCTGRDSIVINPKDCMEGCYIPTAFTPNGDGKNDLLRPMLFGHVKKYLFTVYSRWGGIVFQTSELNKAWDGKLAGLLQDPGVFIWTCVYQFEGEGEQRQKGTVMLIR